MTWHFNSKTHKEGICKAKERCPLQSFHCKWKEDILEYKDLFLELKTNPKNEKNIKKKINEIKEYKNSLIRRNFYKIIEKDFLKDFNTIKEKFIKSSNIKEMKKMEKEIENKLEDYRDFLEKNFDNFEKKEYKKLLEFEEKIEDKFWRPLEEYIYENEIELSNQKIRTLKSKEKVEENFKEIIKFMREIKKGKDITKN